MRRGHAYGRGEHGFAELAEDGGCVMAVETTSAHCASLQEPGGVRVYEAYLKAWQEGQGRADRARRRVRPRPRRRGRGDAAGRVHRAVGVDVRSVAGLWAGAGHDRDGFVVGDVGALPFADDAFDAVVCLGIVEHVGTLTGHLTLAEDYRHRRPEREGRARARWLAARRHTGFVRASAADGWTKINLMVKGSFHVYVRDGDVGTWQGRGYRVEGAFWA